MNESIRQRPFILATDVILIVLFGAGAYFCSEKPWLPADAHENGYGGVVVENSETSTLLQSDDRILRFEGFPIDAVTTLEHITDSHHIGDVVDIEILRKGVRQDLRIQLIPFYPPLYIGVLIFTGGLFVLLGIFVLLQRPQELEAVLFHHLTMLIAAAVMFTSAHFRPEVFDLALLNRTLFPASLALAGAVMLHFSMVFPRRHIRWWLLTPTYIVAVSLAVVATVVHFRANLHPDPSSIHTAASLLSLTKVLIIATALLALVHFIQGYRGTRDEAQRKKIRWVTLGTVISVCGFASWNIIQGLLIRGDMAPMMQNLLWARNFSEEIMLLLICIAPVSFAIAIVRYNIFDIDVIIRRSTLYIIVTVLLLSVYMAVLLISLQLFRDSGTSAMFIIGAAALLLDLALFMPARGVVQRILNRTFFRVSYDYREAQRRFMDQLSTCFGITELAQLIVSNTDELIPVDRIGFFEVHGGALARTLAHRGFIVGQGLMTSFPVDAMQSDAGVPIGLDQHVEPGAVCRAAQREVFDEWQIVLAFAITSEKHGLLALLLLGAKRSGARYNLEDLDLLRTVTLQAGLQMERIRLQRSLVLEHAEAERLEQLNRLKSYFVSSVSHDLKTPLTSIRMFAELLQQKLEDADAETLRYLRIVEGECDRLTRLINNVLSFAKIEEGVKNYHLVPAELNQLVRHTADIIKYQLEIGGYTLRFELCERPCPILADSDAIVEALINLLGNAMKYSRSRKLIVLRSGAEYGRAWVSVVDSGIGIDRKDIPHLFQPFYRAEDPAVQKSGGAGLGLTLVQHIVHAHHGGVDVESVPGTGSTFTLWFPSTEER